MDTGTSLYLHIPFCEVKCGYCDFYSVPRGWKEFELQEQYVEALVQEIVSRMRDGSCHGGDLASAGRPARGGRPAASSGSPAATRPQVNPVTATGGTIWEARSMRHENPASCFVLPASFSCDRTRRQLPVQTIFFGGGTPSLLRPDLLEKIFATLQKYFTWDDSCEITLETNPKTVDEKKLRAFRGLGVNRLSIGVQSFQDVFLKKLGRIHSGREAIATVKAARRAGFENINCDLIFGLPGQNLSGWQQELETALSLKTEHLSCYSLTIESGTPFEKLYTQGHLLLPTEGQSLKMLQWTKARLQEAGLSPYEISNFARLGYECRHNLNYWRYGNYLGFGVAAVSSQHVATGPVADPTFGQPRFTLGRAQRLARATRRQFFHTTREGGVPAGDGRSPSSADALVTAGGPRTHFLVAPSRPLEVWSVGTGPAVIIVRRNNVRSLQRYLENPLQHEEELIDQKTAQGEFAMLTLRTSEGLSGARFGEIFAEPLVTVYGGVLEQNAKRGFLHRTGDSWHLTETGFAIADSIISEFL